MTNQAQSTQKQFKHSKETYPLLKVSGQRKKIIDFNIAEAKKNIIVLGTTGSGKTTSVLLPAIDNLVKHNNAGLILDIKSELYLDVYHIAKQHNREKDIVFIGTQDFCTPINILASLQNEEQLKNVIVACSGSKDDSNDYWEKSGIDDLLNLVMLDKWLHQHKGQPYNYSFNKFLDYLIYPHIALSIYKKLEELRDEMPLAIKSTYTKTLADSFSLYNAASEQSDASVQNQKTWRTGRIATIIRPFTEEPFATNLGDEGNGTTIHDLIFEQGKIVVLTTPIEHESVGFTIGKLIREIYYKAAIRNTPEERERLMLGDKYNRYAFLLIDEYQGFVNTEAANGVITDDSWSSISRSFENINIYATQSISHLDNIISETATDVIMANCGSEIILRAQDRRTLDHVGRTYNKVLKNDLDFLINPTERVCVARLESEGGKLCFKGSMGVDEQLLFHTKDYKSSRDASTKQLIEMASKLTESVEELFIQRRNIHNQTVNLTNKKRLSCLAFVEEHIASDEELNSELNELYRVSDPKVAHNMTLTPYNFDFSSTYRAELIRRIKKIRDIRQKILSRNYMEVMTNDGLQKVLKPSITPSRYIAEDVMFVCKDNYRSWDDVAAKIDIPEGQRITTAELKKRNFKVSETIICFIMGGGDHSSAQFNYFKSEKNFWSIRNANPDSIIYTGLGHAGDSFVFDCLADRSFITPTELAEHLIKIGFPKRY